MEKNEKLNQLIDLLDTMIAFSPIYIDAEGVEYDLNHRLVAAWVLAKEIQKENI